MSTEPDYAAAWRDLKKRRLFLWAAVLGCIPGVFAIVVWIGLPLSLLTGIKLNYFFYPVAASWLLMIGVAGWRVQTFRCPRCHRRFFSARWRHNSFARCLHCGLPAGAKWDGHIIDMRQVRRAG
jgi:hypothetical protein